jgi:hypothetical protein
MGNQAFDFVCRMKISAYAAGDHSASCGGGAAINDAALTLIRRTGQKPRPAREAFAEHKWSAIRLVMNA